MTEELAEKRVGWAELFFDLVFVVAVTRVSTLLEHDHSWGGLLRSLVVFVPVYWTWVGTSVQTNLQDAARPALRLRIFAVALAGVFMAIALPDAYGHLGLVFAIAYWSGRLILGVGLVGAAMRGYGTLLNPFVVSMVITGPLLVAGAFTHGGVREAIWGVAALIDLATPRLFRGVLSHLHFDAGHLAERFGLFVLIALGESVVAVGTSTPTGELTLVEGLAIAAAFALSCGLWWVYFHFAADAMRHALATARVQADITRLVLSYGHLAFIAAIILVAVGLRTSVHNPGHPLSATVTGLLFGGCALYLASFGFTRWAMFRLVSWTRLGAAAVVVLLMPLAPHVPALAALIGLAVVLAVLNTLELLRVQRDGWRALLRRRERVPGAG
ncbi:MAG: low temperature requirement protein A [Actinomycetota bacterium]|nr:low temperature requirement protein A [Actinomycetota bacterium]